MRRIFLSLLVGLPMMATTLEKLSIEQMSQKATAIVRARVEGCRATFRSATIYTICTVRVTESWKGRSGHTVEVATPGGTAQGLSQSFSGAPALVTGQDYVLFLWTGRSGLTQLIGLSQGVFDLGLTSKGEAVAQRSPIAAPMLDAGGHQVTDDGIELRVRDLKRRVTAALEGKTE